MPRTRPRQIADVVADILLAECSTGGAIIVALGLGFAYAVILLGQSAVFGGSSFWDAPVAIMGDTLDIRSALSGYWWFMHDTWRWPLLRVVNPNWPSGTNAELFDIVPVVAIIGKLLRTIFGWQVNPYAWWVSACFALNAAALAILVRTLGQRSVLGVVVASAFGALAPVVQHRFGHMALMAHWIPVLCLALYFHGRPGRLGGWQIAGFAALCLLATFVHMYLYVMTAAIAAAAVLQAALSRNASVLSAIGGLALLVLAGLVPLWMFGLLEGLDPVTSGELSRYSMNLASPFWPQTSGIFGWTGNYWLTRGVIGAAPGQYEGFDYLGGGALLLTAMALLAGWRDFGRVLLRHPALTAALLVLTVWAISSRIYLGPFLLFSYEPPHLLSSTVLSWFRSCGRMFWPVGWLLVAIGVARAPTLFRPRTAIAVAVLALALQWIDVAPWRAKFAQLQAGQPSAFGTPEDKARVAQAVAKADTVAVIPPVFCAKAAGGFKSPMNIAALEGQLMAGRANARMSSVYLSRTRQDCAKPALVGKHGVVIILNDANAASPGEIGLDGADCFEVPIARICAYAARDLSQDP